MWRMSNYPTVTVLSPSVSGSSDTLLAAGLLDYDRLAIISTLTGASGDTLDAYIQRSWDGTTFYDYAHLPQMAANDPAETHAYCPSDTSDIIKVGSGDSPVLAAGEAADGHWGERLRVHLVAGTNTLAGASATFNVFAWRKNIS